MKVIDLKNALKLHFSVTKKTFKPITEYIYINNDEIRSTDLETYVVTIPEIPIPIVACLSSLDLKKFLISLDNDMELELKKMDTFINIKYGKNNNFKLPISIEEFPTLDDKQDCLYTIKLNKNIFEQFENALMFCSKDTTDNFNGVYVTDKNIYSTNREIVYSGKYDFNIGDSFTYIPAKIIKFILDNKDLVDNLHVTETKILVESVTNKIYCMKKMDVMLPDFNKIFLELNESSNDSNITANEVIELSKSLNRFKNFDDFINLKISGGKIILNNDRMNEEIILNDNFIQTGTVKCSVEYLNKILNLCRNLYLIKSENKNNGKMGGYHINFKIIAALVSFT